MSAPESLDATVLREWFLHTISGVVHHQSCASLRTVPPGRLRAIDVERLECSRCCPKCTRLPSAVRRDPQRVGKLSAERVAIAWARLRAENFLEAAAQLGVPFAELARYFAGLGQIGASDEQLERLARMIRDAGASAIGPREGPTS